MEISFNQISDLIKINRFGRYLEDIDIPAIKAEKLVVGNILKSIDSGITKAVFADSQETSEIIGGLILYKYSDWDTNHFEKRTVVLEGILLDRRLNYLAQYELANNLVLKFRNICISDNIKFVVAKIPSLDLISIHTLENNGFRFIESWIYNKYDLRKDTGTYNRDLIPLRLAKNDDLSFMLEYSKNAFNTQRFHADYRIPNDKAESLYFKWIRTAFDDPNQKIIVADIDKMPAAFMIYFINDLSEIFNLKIAMWKMALVNPCLHGIGLGTKFFYSLFDYHKNEGIDIIDSGLSLRNIISLNTHNKVNFKVISTVATFHLWI